MLSKSLFWYVLSLSVLFCIFSKSPVFLSFAYFCHCSLVICLYKLNLGLISSFTCLHYVSPFSRYVLPSCLLSSVSPVSCWPIPLLSSCLLFPLVIYVYKPVLFCLLLLVCLIPNSVFTCPIPEVRATSACYPLAIYCLLCFWSSVFDPCLDLFCLSLWILIFVLSSCLDYLLVLWTLCPACFWTFPYTLPSPLLVLPGNLNLPFYIYSWVCTWFFCLQAWP